VSDALPAGIGSVWAALEDPGYLVTSVRDVGLPEKICENLAEAYFTEALLRHDEGDWPVDRLRARDVVRYQWHDDDKVSLWEHDTITITNRAEIPGKRDHSRIEILEDPQAEELICALLGLIPPGKRQPEGTFGVNLFRTFTNVVTKPHHDNEEYIIIYVLNRIGGGAESYLYRPEDVLDTGEPIQDPVFRYQLGPGEILIFADKRFKHGATPLEAQPGGQAMRDALVCTVDYRHTYLDRQSRHPAVPSGWSGKERVKSVISPVA
jgi:2OG-Fe dioxygenase